VKVLQRLLTVEDPEHKGHHVYCATYEHEDGEVITSYWCPSCERGWAGRGLPPTDSVTGEDWRREYDVEVTAIRPAEPPPS